MIRAHPCLRTQCESREGVTPLATGLRDVGLAPAARRREEPLRAGVRRPDSLLRPPRSLRPSLGLARALAVVVALSALAAQAEVENRAQVWWLAFLQGHLTPRVQVYLEAQPRGALTPPRMDVVLLRAALGFDVLPQLSLWAGFGWIPGWAEPALDTLRVNEGRAWQQALHTFKPTASTRLSSRLRFEERFLQGVSGASLRVRLFERFTWRFSEKAALQLAVQEEIFFTLNARPQGPPQGYDQSRSFLGLGYVGFEGVVLELGYQLQHQRFGDARADRLGHTALVLTSVSW